MRWSELAVMSGASPKKALHADALHRYGGPELRKAAHAGLIPMKHAAMFAKRLDRKRQRALVERWPKMTPRQRHDIVATLRQGGVHA